MNLGLLLAWICLLGGWTLAPINPYLNPTSWAKISPNPSMMPLINGNIKLMAPFLNILQMLKLTTVWPSELYVIPVASASSSRPASMMLCVVVMSSLLTSSSDDSWALMTVTSLASWSSVTSFGREEGSCWYKDM